MNVTAPIPETDGEIIGRILDAEGWPRFTDHPHDRGGPTKGGITLATLRRHFPHATVADLKRLTEIEAEHLYMKDYVIEPGFDAIPDTLLRWQVIDAGVLHGPARATRWLQRSLGGLAVDGVLGPLTRQRLRQADAHATMLSFAAHRIRFIGRILTNTANQRLFAYGWLRRATKFLELAAGNALPDAFDSHPD